MLFSPVASDEVSRDRCVRAQPAHGAQRISRSQLCGSLSDGGDRLLLAEYILGAFVWACEHQTRRPATGEAVQCDLNPAATVPREIPAESDGRLGVAAGVVKPDGLVRVGEDARVSWKHGVFEPLA
mgnify:CR=1 FL=1